MPYIEKSKREILDPIIDEVINWTQKNGTKASLACASIVTVSSDPSMLSAGITNLIEEFKKSLSNKDKIAGDINYCISRIIYSVVDYKNPGYEKSVLNAEAILVQTEELIRISNAPNKVMAIATLRLVSKELYRRLAMPYEDLKMTENGDFIKA